MDRPDSRAARQENIHTITSVDSGEAVPDLAYLLSGLNGPIIEIGGPTDEYFTGKPGELVVSNNSRGQGYIYGNRLSFVGEEYGTEDYEDLDFMADGLSLPLTDDSVGAVFASGIPNTMSHDINQPWKNHFSTWRPLLIEVKRVLEPGGVFVLQATDFFDTRVLDALGFELVFHDEPTAEIHNLILKKIIDDKQTED